jgi:hypothetical protein
VCVCAAAAGDALGAALWQHHSQATLQDESATHPTTKHARDYRLLHMSCNPSPALESSLGSSSSSSCSSSSSSESNRKSSSSDSDGQPAEAELRACAFQLAEFCCSKLVRAPHVKWGPPHTLALVLRCCGQLGFKHTGMGS